MSYIYRRVRAYQGVYAPLNSPLQTVNCKLVDLLRCAITVGNPSFMSMKVIRQQGLWPVLNHSIIEKLSLIYGYMESSPLGLRRRTLFDTVIYDKKKEISYNVGMAFAKFNSEKILHIKTLIHLEYLKRQGAVTFVVPVTGNKRSQEPDLVGQTQDGQWHIFEGKGRSNRGDISKATVSGKRQAAQVALINGQAPSTRSVSATYCGRDRIETLIEDPDGASSEKININYEKFMSAYYAPFFATREVVGKNTQKVTLDGMSIEQFTIEFDGHAIKIGLSSDIIGALRDEKSQAISSVLESLSNLSTRETDQYSFGLDGFVVGDVNARPYNVKAS